MHGLTMRRITRSQAGTTLVEALIALLILSLSALGYAALQLQGVSKNASALWRSKATQLAYGMADRLRANQGGVAAGAYTRLVASVTAPQCGATSPCSLADMATADYARWRDDVASALPGGIGVVCVTSTPVAGSSASPACDGNGVDYAIKVFWTENTTESLFATVVRP